MKADGSNKAIVPFGAATLPKLGSGAIPRPRANPSLIERQVSLFVCATGIGINIYPFFSIIYKFNIYQYISGE